MSDLMLDLVTYLVDNTVFTADGTDVFRDYMPAMPDDVTALYELTALSSNVDTVTGRYVEIQSRAPSIVAAKAKCWQVYKALQQVDDPIITLANGRWLIMHPQRAPVKSHVDASGRTIYSCSFLITTDND